MEISVGDVVLTEGGEATVLQYNAAMSQFWVQVGALIVCIPEEEMEEIPEPDPRNQDEVETWLRAAAQWVPSAAIVTKTVRCEEAFPACTCDCCHTVLHERPGTHTVVNRFHFLDNPTCSCPRKGCACS